MYEFLLNVLPESAQACRRLYDVETGGYHLPLREHNVALRIDDIDRYRARYPRVLFDCVETPVADLLYALVVNTRSRWILETGTSRGFSTAHLAAGAQFVGGDAARVLTIDLDPAPNPFFADSRVSGTITAIRADSLAIDLQPLMGGAKFDFMFFDSLHTYAHLSRELAHYLPHLKAGGLFALHDTMVYDDLGLVVAWLAKSGVVETVSLPTHRTHGERSRSPGLTLFRKIDRIGPGDLLFPDLEGVVEGERQSLSQPDQIVKRTGSLFADRRYAMSGLHRGGPRDDQSPPLLECTEALREREAGVVGPWQDRLAAFVKQTAPPADSGSIALHRHRRVDGAERRTRDEWWRLHGALEARLHRWLPDLFAPASQRRALQTMATSFAGADEVVHLVCHTAPGASALQSAIDAATRVRQVCIGPWGDGRDDLPAAGAYLIDGVLNHCSATEIAHLVGRLRKVAPPGAKVVVVEPVCFPAHRPDDRARALAQSIHALLAAQQHAVHREGTVFSSGSRQTRTLLAKRWWGELPCGPAPLQRPFVGDELDRLLAQHFRVERSEIVQGVIAQALGRDLALLADDDPRLARRLAAEFMPALDELEASLLAREPLPDVSWYLSMVVAVA